MQTATYFDIDSGERETVFFYMLNAYLHARIDTQNESDGDEEVNVYMSHLLGSLVDGSFYVRNGDVLASTPVDVLHRIEADDSDRHKVNVYRGNADHRLIAFGLFERLGRTSISLQAQLHVERGLPRRKPGSTTSGLPCSATACRRSITGWR